MRRAPVATEARAWTRRMASTASARRDSSRRTATRRWMSAAAAPASMGRAGTTSTGKRAKTTYILNCFGQKKKQKTYFLCSYRCDCEPGWVGKNCDIDRNDCLPSPCQNAGTCIDQLNGFTCKCRQGFRGKPWWRRRLNSANVNPEPLLTLSCTL